MCPDCGSDDVEITQYDFGIDEEAGWSDRGAWFRCMHCGAAGEFEQQKEEANA